MALFKELLGTSLPLSHLVGLTMFKVERVDEAPYSSDQVVFTTTDGHSFVLKHYQDCCESVTIESIDGDLSDLEGSPILEAERVTNSSDSQGFEPARGVTYDPKYDSATWTFFKFATFKGRVTISFFGVSNGYYREDAELREIDPEEDIGQDF